MYKKIVTLLLSLSVVLGLVGCGKLEPGMRKDKEQIYIYVYDGGHGTQWVKDLCDAFNEETGFDRGYQVWPVFAKFNEQQLLSTIGKDEYRMYISSPCAFTSAIYEEKLADISDILDDYAAQGETKTIGEKMLRREQFQEIYSKHGEGLYAMPFAESVMSFVYDHDLFLEEEWYYFANETDDGAALTAQGISFSGSGDHLTFVSSTGKTNYVAGDRILSAGKDGKYGTYDDGQPITEEEWEETLRLIANTANQYPLTWSGAVAPYANNVFSAIFAQYSGMEDFSTYFRFDSEGKEVELIEGIGANSVSNGVVNYSDSNKVSRVITPENGLDVYKMEGIIKAYEFMNKYMNYNNPSAKRFINTKGAENANSQFDAQNQFLLGTLGGSFNADNPRSAMLLEGAWWEYEAKPMFDTLGQYGKREYRYMLLPDLEGQKMEKSAISCEETGIYFLAKDDNESRLDVTKSFLKYLLRDENMRFFTRETGSILPYEYDLTAEDEAALTPFARNMRELYYDTENIEVVRHSQMQMMSPISFATDKNLYERYPTRIMGTRNNTIVTVLENYGIDGLKVGLFGLDGAQGIRSPYSETEWQNFLNACKNNGFEL